jgi:hypothetical protein
MKRSMVAIAVAIGLLGTVGAPVEASEATVGCDDVLASWGIVQTRIEGEDEEAVEVDFVDPAGVYTVSNINQLYCIGEGAYDADGNPSTCEDAPLSGLLNGTYTLTGNLDFDDLSITGVTDWRPIGFNGCQFNGVFDGNSKSIANLTYDRPHETFDSIGLFEGVGLFGSTGRDGTAVIENLSLSNVYFAGFRDVGGVVGIADKNTTIRNVSVTGTVVGSQEGWGDIGGIVGWTNGDENEMVFIEDVTVDVELGMSSSIDPDMADDTLWSIGGVVGYAGHTLIEGATVSVVASSEFMSSLGGVVGYISGSTTVRNVVVDGSLTGNESIGGVVGWSDNNATIENGRTTVDVVGTSWLGGASGGGTNTTIREVYSTGSVTGDTYVGGLVGNPISTEIVDSAATGAVMAADLVGSLAGEVTDSTISTSYAVGALTATGDEPEHVGGLVGRVADAEGVSVSTASYWNAQSTGRATSALGDSRTTVQMQSIGTYSGWDIASTGSNSTVWGICAGTNGGYPFLQIQRGVAGHACSVAPASSPAASVVETAPPQEGATVPTSPRLTRFLVRSMTPEAIGALSPNALRGMDAATIRAISPDQARMLSATQIRVLTRAQLLEFKPEALAALRPRVLASIRPAILLALSPRQLASLTERQIAKLPAGVKARFDAR